MLYKDKFEIIKRFSIENGLTPLQTIELLTTVDAMEIDVEDLAKIDGFIGVRVFFTNGKGLLLLRNGVVIRSDWDPLESAFVVPAQS